ncbi:hypothetical protein [Seonamhaeicola sp.]|uniref:hypothetical protein n=1 Tax=Seonamhaeicola sp. TaxID=1912245 RepID=UPI0026346939|nr:hypothetical protein [Seonamhaeicola sp.]
MSKADLIIRESSKPIINKIIVSLLYAGFFTYTIYLFMHKDIWNHPDRWTVIILLSILLIIIFSSTFMSIASHSIHIRIEDKKIQHQYRVGVFRYKEVWQNLVDPEYISVFKNGGYYLINLWYQKNGILNLMALKNYDKAIEKGLLISEKLNIDLLDARERGHHKWVNKKATKEAGKIVYAD